MTVLIIIASIAFQVYLTSKKVSPFISLLIISVFSGLALGIEPALLIKTFEKGVGNTLGGLVLIVCLGAILGKILEESGAALCISKSLISGFGLKYIQWAVMVAGFLIGIPLFYNAGFVILIPLVFSVAKSAKLPILYIALPMACALSVTHCFLPPHPGPVLLIKTFNANFGLTLLYGIFIAIPAVIIGGPMLSKLIRHSSVAYNENENFYSELPYKKPPLLLPSIFIALLPILLILIGVLVSTVLKDGIIKTCFQFYGEATMAIFITIIVAFYYFGIKENISFEQQSTWITSAISGVAMIIMIIAAGGIFKQVLIDSGTADKISAISLQLKLPPLLFAWLVTALIRVSVGSATVAGVTAAGIVAPLLSITSVSPELMVLSIGAGSVFGSHINDSGFWMFKEYFNLSLKQTFLSWTLMESVVSIIGLIGVLILDFFM